MRKKPIALLLLAILISLSLVGITARMDPPEARADITEREAQLTTLPENQQGELLTALVKHYRDNDPLKSLAYGEQALTLFSKIPDDIRKVTVLNNMAWIYVSLSQYENAQLRTDQAKQLAKASNDPHGLFTAQTMQGIIYWRKADYQTALKTFEQAQEIAKQEKNLRGIASTTNYMAIIYQTLGQPEKALDYFIRAFNIQKEVGDEKSIAVSLNNIANMYGTSGNYSLALDYQLQSRKIREELNDLPGLAQILGNIGLTYFYLKDSEQALSYLQRSLGYYESLKDQQGIAEIHGNLGMVHLHEHQLESALLQYQEALALAKAIPDTALEARINIDLANAYIELDDPEQAFKQITTGLDQANKLGIVSLSAYGLLTLAKVEKLRGNSERALTLSAAALNSSQQLQDKRIVRDAHEFRYQLYKHLGQAEQALASLEAFKQVNDEMFNSESDQRMAFLLSHFEAEQQEQQIKLLQADQALQKTQLAQHTYQRNVWLGGLSVLFIILLLLVNRHHQRKINASLNQNIQSQRELIQAVAHEFRSPLARVQLAFDMLEEQFEQDKPTRLIDTINKGLSELEKLIKEALDFIQIESKSRPLHLSQVNLNKLLGELMDANSVLYPDKTFKLEVNPSEACLVKADSTQIARAFSNILRNAARFARSQVLISLKQEKSRILVIIEDDGPGIPTEQRERVFEPFVRLDQSRCRDSGGIGLGLALAKKICEAHGGALTISASQLGGAKLSLACPLVNRESDNKNSSTKAAEH
ncbi:tetratricopeptide repeat protein [Shewanella loihica]|uniref:histidine kinase n=1 Tax=Shewanella loihica (strain ATCC BAA-1088 / PV-4) TaxID=323850 RepID=A3QF25_SHELP|nr:tetratricopeptide repeat protein [Shewanella loihica]ABO24073.1 integral membrane sensor signal transduction histidine kinase [Shewanella loihica PV-4]